MTSIAALLAAASAAACSRLRFSHMNDASSDKAAMPNRATIVTAVRIRI
jgi:hypothetical protein